MSEFDKQIAEYRRQLWTAAEKAITDYDKAVMTLSGGALGLSFAFLKDVVGNKPLNDSNFLLWAWICWGASIGCVLVSLFTSYLATRKALHQTDEKLIYVQTPGGFFDWVTRLLNPSGGVLFLFGIVLLVLFVKSNLR